MTAAAVLGLAQDGLVNLSNKITDILNLTPPPGGTADARLEDVTIRNLLQHLGGWDPGVTFHPIFYDAQIASVLGLFLPASTNDALTGVG
jgi:CubicO group peptidase (beta-lactamase class C family)